MTEQQQVSIEISAEQAEKLSDLNIPNDLLDEIISRHREKLEEGIQREAIVSEREVPMANGHAVVWGDWP